MANQMVNEEARHQSRKRRVESIEEIRGIYRGASKDFLLNQPWQVWAAIQTGLEAIQQRTPSRGKAAAWWEQPPSTIDSTIDHEYHELQRKFLILRITLATSILPATQAILNLHQHHSSSSSLLRWLQNTQDPVDFILSLVISIQNSLPELVPCNSTTPQESQTRLIQLSTELTHLHPSILTALGLATIKLNIPHIGKLLIEGWIANLPPFFLLTNDRLRIDYRKLVLVYSVHILGSLHDWNFAISFVNNQSSLVGGFLPPESVHNILDAIEVKKTQLSRLKQQALIRQQEKQEQQSTNQHQELIKQQSQAQRSKNESTSRHNKKEEGHVMKRKKDVEYPTTTMMGGVVVRRDSSSTTTTPTPTTSDQREGGGGGYHNFRSHLSSFISSDRSEEVERTTASPWIKEPPSILRRLLLLFLPFSSSSNSWFYGYYSILKSRAFYALFFSTLMIAFSFLKKIRRRRRRTQSIHLLSRLIFLFNKLRLNPPPSPP